MCRPNRCNAKPLIKAVFLLMGQLVGSVCSADGHVSVLFGFD